MRLFSKLAGLVLLATISCGHVVDGLYTVSGTVVRVDAQGNKTPLAGIVVALSGSRTTVNPVAPIVLVNTDTTDAKGHYAIRTASGTYRVSAVTDGYTISPIQYDLSDVAGDVDNQDFEAVAQ